MEFNFAMKTLHHCLEEVRAYWLNFSGIKAKTFDKLILPSFNGEDELMHE